MAETEEENMEAEAAAEAPPAPDNEQDKVKPVVFIGLFITALLGLGKLGDQYLEIISCNLPFQLCRYLRCFPKC